MSLLVSSREYLVIEKCQILLYDNDKRIDQKREVQKTNIYTQTYRHRHTVRHRHTCIDIHIDAGIDYRRRLV